MTHSLCDRAGVLFLTHYLDTFLLLNNRRATCSYLGQVFHDTLIMAMTLFHCLPFGTVTKA